MKSESYSEALVSRLKDGLDRMSEAVKSQDWELLSELEPEASQLVQEAFEQTDESSGQVAELLMEFQALYLEAVRICEHEQASIHEQLAASRRRQDAMGTLMEDGD